MSSRSHPLTAPYELTQHSSAHQTLLLTHTPTTTTTSTSTSTSQTLLTPHPHLALPSLPSLTLYLLTAVLSLRLSTLPLTPPHLLHFPLIPLASTVPLSLLLTNATVPLLKPRRSRLTNLTSSSQETHFSPSCTNEPYSSRR